MARLLKRVQRSLSQSDDHHHHSQREGNGILHLMIKNDWIDHSFIEKWTVGFAELASSVEEWTAERTAKITGMAQHPTLIARGNLETEPL